jgi:hypothetical protein
MECLQRFSRFPIAVAALAIVLTVSEPAAAMELQLDLARNTQQVQRQEFPLAGDDSAFKFNFAEIVRSFEIARHSLNSFKPIFPLAI